MPIYEYQCDACQHKFEILQKVSDPLLEECPECKNKALRKLVSAAAFRLKGTGWYATDFKDKPAGKTDEKSKPDTEKNDSKKTQNKDDKSTSASSSSAGDTKSGSDASKKPSAKTD